MCVCSLIYPACQSHLYVPYCIAVSGLMCCTAFWHIILQSAAWCAALTLAHYIAVSDLMCCAAFWHIILQSAACCAALPFGTLYCSQRPDVLHCLLAHYIAVSGLLCCTAFWHIILQSAACCAALPFGTLYYKRHEFRRRFIEYKMCVPIFPTVLSETFHILRRI